MDKIKATNVDFYYGNFHALKNISLTIPENQVVAFIGPSGCGKSTFLRLFNRMNDLIPNTRLTGNISIETLTDTAMMQIYVLLNDHDRYLPAIERTRISVETDNDNCTVILYTFPELDTATAARYGAIVLTPDNSPQYYTLERTPRGRMVLCRIAVWRHTIVRCLPGGISAEEFISMSKSLSTISGQEDSDMSI